MQCSWCLLGYALANADLAADCGRFVRSGRIDKSERTYSPGTKDGNEFVVTGFRGKENGMRKRVLTYSMEWNGHPDAVITSQVLGLDPYQIFLFLKQEGVTHLESKAAPK